MPYSPKAASTPTYTTPNLNIEKCNLHKKTEQTLRFFMQNSMPPTALYRCTAVFHATDGTQKQPCDNATRFVFYICSRLTASSRTLSVLGGIPCHRRHSKLTLRQRYAFCFLYMLALDCKQSHSIGARRYFMPPTALKNNLATTLRVLLFYICSYVFASESTAYIKKQPYGFRKVVFSFGAGGRTRTDTDD